MMLGDQPANLSLFPELPAFSPDPTVDDLLRRAVDLITNVNEGYWNRQTSQWQGVAAAWMREVHQLPAQRHDRPSERKAAELVFTALGAASTCWEDMSGTGVFDDRRAARIGNRLLVDLGFRVPEGYLLRDEQQEMEAGELEQRQPIDLTKVSGDERKGPE